MLLKKIALLIGGSVFMSGCALWPYKRDFDCPVKEGLKCKSLYEISRMADEGRFGPNAKGRAELTKESGNKTKSAARGSCVGCNTETRYK